MVNFTQCAANYLALAPDDPLRLLYGWSGSVEGIERNSTTQISEHGCVEFCGDVNDLYPWSQSSNTITTWVLPVVGMLLQAPFVSNAFWQTILSLARWVGSPMASLSYILWNIKVSGKCVMMVDMAIPYGDYPSEKSDFGSIRDSFYILSTMNQYTMKRRAMRKKESEGLLRIVLFSKDLKLLDPSRTLDERRRAMAQEMREGRRRGVVPVFISTMWFLFSLAISIQSAFGYLGSNATAHDLALGCLLSWMPVLILCSIVDRNPVASEDIRNKLNDLVDIVRQSLIDDTIRDKFIESCPRETVEDMRLWIETIAAHCPKMDHFFQDFAGQGRVRWHYGAAHPILSDIEMTYVALQGRDWLRNESEARTRLVLGSVTEGLDWFDYRELWQISSAIIIVGATCGGAFILSFFTPTVGLGCRSGGYTIFFCISFILLFVEMLIWWCVDANKPLVYQFGDQLNRTFTRRLTMVGWHAEVPARYARIQDRARRAAAAAASAIFDGLLTLIPSYEQRDKINNAKQQMIKAWEESTLQGRFEYLFFRPVEVFNASWLIYITLAQTFGSYVNCHCMSSTWAGGGGYIDFTQYSTTSSPWVKLYWTSGAVISAGVMGIAMTYVVVEWCLQSNLSTSSWPSAMRGLRRSRQFRKYTYPVRLAADLAIEAGYLIRTLVLLICRRQRQHRRSRRSLVWTVSDGHHTRPSDDPSPANDRRSSTFRTPNPLNPSFELTPAPFRDRSGSQSPLLQRPFLTPGTSYQVSEPDRTYSGHPSYPHDLSARASTNASPRASIEVRLGDTELGTAHEEGFLGAVLRPSYERQTSENVGLGLSGMGRERDLGERG